MGICVQDTPVAEQMQPAVCNGHTMQVCWGIKPSHQSGGSEIALTCIATATGGVDVTLWRGVSRQVK